MGEADDALKNATELMGAMGTDSIAHLGKWNALLLYLEKKAREGRTQ